MVSVIVPPSFLPLFLESYSARPYLAYCFFQDEIAFQKYYLFRQQRKLLHSNLLLPATLLNFLQLHSKNERNKHNLLLTLPIVEKTEQIQAYSSPYEEPYMFHLLHWYQKNGVHDQVV